MKKKPIKFFLGMTIFFLLGVTIYKLYNGICSSSSECACKDAKPGDPTCFSKEQIDSWCDSQSNRLELPQCI